MVGFAVGVFVRVAVGKLVGIEVTLVALASIESFVPVGTNDAVFIGLGIGASRMLDEGVGNGWTVSPKPTVAVKEGTGTIGKPYRLASSSPKIAR